ncbi:GNAT family N-acetyltransferase [Alicyclobacillus sp. ALC3]|uniref:GNAT family N-acetyltransferase n=1 Tax=Alicyclobacillus sp. ALC3 TaxID=2796143 RepID=UPI0023780FD3|nr:GNAT family N-acetyltransferase [Alicyclobacillus sp. ALC3]WDL97252.1 GNAT family N-acetyltransferase [Alicyclobacillus sp. ALC3]
MVQNDLSLAILNERDIPQLIQLSDSVGWDYDESEIKTIMESGMIYGYKTVSGKVAASAAIVPYNKNLASLGMVIVHPHYRRLGLGKTVTMKCVQSLPSSVPIMLIATAEGIPMYERLGFRSVNSVQKLLCDSFQRPMNLDTNEFILERFHDRNLSQIIDLDQVAVGAKRDTFLIARIKQANQIILAKNTTGRVVGYALSIQGTVNLLVGPIVAPDAKLAMQLLEQLATNNSNTIRIDVPQEQTQFTSMLVRCGFELVSQPPIMLLNGDELPPRSGQLFAIAAQVFG